MFPTSQCQHVFSIEVLALGKLLAIVVNAAQGCSLFVVATHYRYVFSIEVLALREVQATVRMLPGVAFALCCNHSLPQAILR